MIGRRATRMVSAILGICVAVGASHAAAAEAKYETIRDVVYATPDGSGPLKADIYRPTGEGPFPAVLCIHGGGWMSGNKSQLAGIASRLAEAGYTAVSINYRLAPTHRFPAQIDDCRAALAWMRANAKQYKIDPDRLGAWGYSAGAHLATLLGVTDQGLKAVVAGGTPCDFRQLAPDNRALAFWLGGSRKELPEVYTNASPASFVSADDPPMLFYHGQDDMMVPLDQPKEMVTALQKAGVAAELHLVPNTGHIMTLLSRDVPAEGIKFLDKHLRPR